MKFWLAAWGLLSGAMLLGACARPAVFVQATAVGEHTAGVKLTEAARTRIIFNRGTAAAGWPSVALRNDGFNLLHNVQVWDVAGEPFFDPKTAPRSEPTPPFSLIPGESLASTVFENGGKKSMLLGLAWSMPLDRGAARVDFSRLEHARIEPRPEGGRGNQPGNQPGNRAASPMLVLAPQGGEAQAELTFDAPVAFKQAFFWFQVGAPQAAPRVTPSVWVSVEKNIWARITPPPLGVSPTRPLDLSPMVEGHRAFAIRLGLDRPPVTEDPGVGLLVFNLNLQCQWDLPGEWRAWRPGLNELDVNFTNPIGTRPVLAVELSDFAAAAREGTAR